MRRTNAAAGGIFLQLPSQFFDKLKSTITSARDQMEAYNSGGSGRRIVYMIVNFDDSLNQYVDDYSSQIQEFTAAQPIPNVEIVFHMKPKYYSATR